MAALPAIQSARKSGSGRRNPGVVPDGGPPPHGEGEQEAHAIMRRIGKKERTRACCPWIMSRKQLDTKVHNFP